MNKRDLLKASLTSDEVLIWSEAPHPLAFIIRWEFAYGLLFLALWLGIGTSFFYGPDKYKNGGSIFILCFGLIIFFSLFSDSLKSLFTIYGITNKRLVVLKNLPWKSELDSFFPTQIDAKKKARRKNGSGDLIFAVIIERNGKRTYEVEIGFLGVRDVDAVERLIENSFLSKRT